MWQSTAEVLNGYFPASTAPGHDALPAGALCLDWTGNHSSSEARVARARLPGASTAPVECQRHGCPRSSTHALAQVPGARPAVTANYGSYLWQVTAYELSMEYQEAAKKRSSLK